MAVATQEVIGLHFFTLLYYETTASSNGFDDLQGVAFASRPSRGVESALTKEGKNEGENRTYAYRKKLLPITTVASEPAIPSGFLVSGKEKQALLGTLRSQFHRGCVMAREEHEKPRFVCNELIGGYT
jgi:hypothetical protein